jgi:Subtilase family
LRKSAAKQAKRAVYFHRPLRTRLCLEALEERAVPSAYPLSPLEARHVYGFDTLPLSGNDGAGQTIAIIDAYDDPNIFSDLNTFDQTYGLVSGGPSLYAQYGSSSAVLTKATAGGAPRGNAGWAEEISLDVEWAHAIAPGAHILLVEAKSSGLSDLLNAVDYATKHGASVVSMSWGTGEFSGETSYDSHFAHSGITYVASAGDSGSVGEWPAVSPNVVGVGGTTLTLDSSSNYVSESGWSSSGGGISAYESKPSFQSNVLLSSTRRTSPDVGYDADPNTGFSVYDSYGGAGGWGQYGGTSAGAPQWAALVAITNEGRSSPLSSSGTLNGLYSLLSSNNTINTIYLHDVITGSSGTYSAAPGYDLVTGVGSPVAGQLIPYLRGVSANVVVGAASTTSTTSNSATSAVRTVHAPPGLSPSIVGIIASAMPQAGNTLQTAAVHALPLGSGENIIIPGLRTPETVLAPVSQSATKLRLIESATRPEYEGQSVPASDGYEDPGLEQVAPATPASSAEEILAPADSWPQAVTNAFILLEREVTTQENFPERAVGSGFNLAQAVALAGVFFIVPNKVKEKKSAPNARATDWWS